MIYWRSKLLYKYLLRGAKFQLKEIDVNQNKSRKSLMKSKSKQLRKNIQKKLGNDLSLVADIFFI